MKLKQIALITIILISLLSFKNVNTVAKYFNLNISSIVIAEDDEEEEEKDEEEEKEYDDEDDYEAEPTPPQDNTPSSLKDTKLTTSSKVVPTIKEEIVTQYVNVTDADYAKDTDGDKLVDAIDPNPNKSQFDFFTDTDNDGVPNAYDEFPGKNDFLYRGNLDENNNGIVDSYE